MNYLIQLIIFTANILGSFNDPFEFDGNYGEEINPIREYVFEQVVSKEALAIHLTESQIKELLKEENPSQEQIKQHHQQLIAEAIQADSLHGPTLKELVPNTLIQRLREKQHALQFDGFTEHDLTLFIDFINRYGDQKVFAFFRHAPSTLLKLDKLLPDTATRQGKAFDLPILSSTTHLRGNNSFELKSNLLDEVFTIDIFTTVNSENISKDVIKNLDPDYLKQFFGKEADTDDLGIFNNSSGQIFFYWLYQSLNLHLISENVEMIPQINKVKKLFAETLGNPKVRAQMFRDQLIAADASVVFTQESDAVVPSVLSENGLFHSINAQNPADGTFVFLRSDIWEPSYEMISMEDYSGYEKGRLNVVLATKKDSGEKFLLASCHGNSTRAEDGRLQITKVVEKFHQLNQSIEDHELQLMIGIDANTKSDEDVELLREHLESLGLVSTHVGPTTVKKRMVTAQHAKAGRFAADEEDYVITLKPQAGGRYVIMSSTVGFKEEKPNPMITLPNISNPSDHYPVGATVKHLQR